MPDRIRTSWRCAQRRRRVIGRLAGAIGAMASSPAGAAEQPALALHELVLDAHRGIAQMVVAPIQQAKIVESTSLDATGREAGGFGSTGMATANRPAKQTE